MWGEDFRSAGQVAAWAMTLKRAKSLPTTHKVVLTSSYKSGLLFSLRFPGVALLGMLALEEGWPSTT